MLRFEYAEAVLARWNDGKGVACAVLAIGGEPLWFVLIALR